MTFYDNMSKWFSEERNHHSKVTQIYSDKEFDWISPWADHVDIHAKKVEQSDWKTCPISIHCYLRDSLWTNHYI